MSRSKWLLLGSIVLCLGCCVLLPCTEKVRDGAGWVRSANSLRVIGLALQNYHNDHGKLPPAVVRDKAGRPMYSWRVVLLPYVEQPVLHAEFKLDEPWDSPTNKPLSEKMP